MDPEVNHDFARRDRIGLSEAVLCAGKTPAQIGRILDIVAERDSPLLLTRLAQEQFEQLDDRHSRVIAYDPGSRTGIVGSPPAPSGAAVVAIVTGGTSDLGVAGEAERTLAFHGHGARRFADVGVAGLWRIQACAEELATFPVVIVVAGMEGALFSVVGGLVGGVVIAVPTSVGYGVAAGGATALNAALAACAPGILVTNIDNGYGAACAARRVLNVGKA